MFCDDVSAFVDGYPTADLERVLDLAHRFLPPKAPLVFRLRLACSLRINPSISQVVAWIVPG
jgi:hypothetical protein